MSRSHLDPERSANLAENPYAGQGPVMLDIGDDIGAIVLHLPASLEGAEVEIERRDEASPPGHHHRPHVAVVARPTPAGVAYTAVFSALVAGPYALRIPGASDPLRVEVAGGEVTETEWPAAGTTHAGDGVEHSR